MKLFNNTPNGAYYDISYGNDAECGSLKPGQTLDLPSLNNQQNVKVAFTAIGKAPPGETCPFSVSIPQTGTGMAVTIGIFQE